MLYIVWFLVTLFSIGLHVPFFLSSLYNLIMLVAVGSALPKGKGQSGDIMQVLRTVSPIMAMSGSVVAFSVGDTVLGVLGMIAGVSGFLWAVYDLTARKS